MNLGLLLATLACCIYGAWSCEAGEPRENGCKIEGYSCLCGYGCRSEFVYKTRRDCYNAIREMQAAATAPPVPERSSNICSSTPCVRGICAQTTNEPGFACMCAGTGYYGQRCEKGCPTTPINGMVFPHECIII